MFVPFNCKESESEGAHVSPRTEEGDEECDCDEDWTGLNCNVCKNDNACVGFPLRSENGTVLPPPEGGDVNMTCYRNGPTVINNHYMCDVTNPKIIDQLKEKKPQVTFSCDSTSESCTFQFWIASVESFYCALDECKSSFEVDYKSKSNTTRYDCAHLKCNCIADRMLCGQDGSVNIDDFLAEEIKGPAQFTCKTGSGGCTFEEDAMNELITSIFGDPYITLDCDGGECVHYSQIPGYIIPPRPGYSFDALWISAGVAGGIFLAALLLLWYLARPDEGRIKLAASDASKLISDHVPASLHFSNLSYSLGEHTILDNITGAVKPGQVLAIMGASGAGKSTLLDILARRQKRGQVAGETLVNGRVVSNSMYRKVVGYVDQEDTLMSTLTVYETVFYSALLRLPREMSIEAKRFRTLETMNELGILHIRDSRIGEAGRRSISGGEKRRVSIACELVTSPSILFLDEPTSGLDAYNAYNVVECLHKLAREYKRTVIFTIHQPRSNIVSLFDRLIVLAKGKLVYSGDMQDCHTYFANIGYPCPPGFNIADYLIDMTMDTEDSSAAGSTAAEDVGFEVVVDSSNIPDEERGLGTSSPAPPPNAQADPTEPSATGSAVQYLKSKTSRLFEVVKSSASSTRSAPALHPKLAGLVQAYATSDIAATIRSEISAVQIPADASNNATLPDVEEENAVLRGRQRATWLTQFRILSGRAFKNLYRDPALLWTHYIAAISIALIAGFFYFHVANGIKGFQNRLGLFFFALALFGFSCLSSLGLFAKERVLFMRERANGYYSTFTYFSSKVLFDIVPLRVVPPLVFGGIVYGLVGLVPTVIAFWKFQLVLVLFNLTTASVCLLLSVAFSDTGVASLVGTLVMLFNLLFAGLLINRESVPKLLHWLFTISFFHAAYEALAVNELRYLTVIDRQAGVNIEIPAATVLSLFGLRAQWYWTDVSILGGMFVIYTVLSFVFLHFFVKERR
ncbi:hypothetical protein EXIGLDRAFT_739854 [Exidia glandulosa HHB12029]|uniref:ABC transporter domain-containing protein n=1 Tax=Exidia glandulosa HHB12029 TaxID=1314781 RepID=A0A165JDM0_EXIGL|nr:hypothetical protein EXIGLDRAFT_739854 [Exidia glandulosa HHB12029]